MRWKPWHLAVAIGAGVLILGSGGVAAVAYVMDNRSKQDKLRSTLRAAAEAAGVDPDIPDALAYVESRWNPAASNTVGPDAARGGSFGPTQISMKTAMGYGFTGTPDDLMAEDGATAAYWTAVILAARPGGCGQGTDIRDAAAWWNAGKPSAAAVPSTSSAQGYMVKAASALAMVQASPPADASDDGTALA